MNGLEAIRLMEQGSQVSDGEYVYKIENNLVLVRSLNGKLFNIDNSFDFTSEYEEYIEPKLLTGWERVNYNDNVYVVGDECNIALWTEKFASANDNNYNNASYFSTKEKAEEINFKQTLFRRLQRFSDENGGLDINWNNCEEKFCIYYNYEEDELDIGCNWFTREYGQVYFISEEVAKNAIELFRDELIKYFTQYK